MRQQIHKVADNKSKPCLLEAMYFGENDDATVAMLHQKNTALRNHLMKS